jgi:hypothetical protein
VTARGPEEEEALTRINWGKVAKSKKSRRKVEEKSTKSRGKKYKKVEKKVEVKSK